MIPEGLATLYAFLGLVAPGLLFQMLREKRRPALEETAFREASHVALTSLAFTTASVVLLAGLSMMLPNSFPDLAEWLKGGDKYAASNFWLIVWGLAAEVLLACLFAYGTDRLLQHDDTSAHPIVSGGIWHPLFSSELANDQVAWVKVELSSGASFWGYVDYFTIGEDVEQREIVLKGPNLSVQAAGSTTKTEETYWKYVVLKYSDIRAIKIAHEPRAAQ